MSFHLTPKAGPAAGNSPIGELLRKPFLTALLLTGSAARAESAVSEAIHSLSEPSADALLHEAVAVSVREPAELPPRSGDEVESAAIRHGVAARGLRARPSAGRFAALTLAGLGSTTFVVDGDWNKVVSTNPSISGCFPDPR